MSIETELPRHDVAGELSVSTGSEMPIDITLETGFAEQANEPAEQMSERLKLRTRVSNRAKDVLATAAVGQNLPGSNELWRGGAIIGTQLALHSAAITTASVTGETFLGEAAAAYGMSRLMATERGGRIMNRASKILGKAGLKGEQETSVVTDAAVAYTTGTGLMLANKQRTNSDRTEAENVRYGTRMAAVISAASVPVTFLAAETLGASSLPEKVGAGSLAVAGLVGASRWATARRDAKAKLKEMDEVEQAYPVEARYDLDDESLATIEKSLVDRVRKENGKTLTAVWIRGDTEEANFMRTHESRTFPDINAEILFGPYDDTSAFLAMVDTRRSAGDGRVIRGTRITGSRAGNGINDDIVEQSGMGMAMFRDMVVDGQVTADELRTYYQERGIDLSECIAVETNFRIGGRADRWLKFIPAADAAYFAMYDYVTRDHKGDRSKASERMIFAHINDATERSLGRLGIEADHVVGRELRTPAGPGAGKQYDDRFKPVAMANTPKTAKIMKRLSRFAPREMYL